MPVALPLSVTTPSRQAAKSVVRIGTHDLGLESVRAASYDAIRATSFSGRRNDLGSALSRTRRDRSAHSCEGVFLGRGDQGPAGPHRDGGQEAPELCLAHA